MSSAHDATTQTNILNGVMDILVEKLRCKPEDVEPDTLLFEDLGADSLDLAEMVMVFEEKYGFDVPNNEDSAAIKTVQDIVNLIERCMAS